MVFFGPNNSGKTTALQALALWHTGLGRWNEKRSGMPTPARHPGVTINRRDLVSIPIPSALLLWHRLHVRDVLRGEAERRTDNVRIDIVVDGITDGRTWSCGLEFDYANEESVYCRPPRIESEGAMKRMPVPIEAARNQMAFHPHVRSCRNRGPRGS